LDQLLQQFEQAVTDAAGVSYRVYVYGRSRPADTWQGWIVFERTHDNARFATPVETTQPSADAIRYWAQGLSQAYFDGALWRAMHTGAPAVPRVPKPPPATRALESEGERRRRLEEIAQDVTATFTRLHARRLLTREVFDALPYAHADVVRAVTHLADRGFVTRLTEDGDDWLSLA
jgi:hypothetical protein